MDQGLNSLILEQVWEESRYHRQFHHTVWTIYLTLYVALLGVEVSFPETLSTVRSAWLGWLFGVVVFVVVPAYYVWIVLDYHRTIARLNSLIAILMPAGSHVGSLLSDETTRSRFEAEYKKFTFDKYRGVITAGSNPIGVGRGHWFFLVIFFCLWLCDLIFFFFWTVNQSSLPLGPGPFR